MVLQTLSLLQIIGDLILFKHHSFQSILHACQTGLVRRTGLPRFFLFLCFAFSVAFVFLFVIIRPFPFLLFLSPFLPFSTPLGRFFILSLLSLLGLYSPLNNSICFNQSTFTVIPYIGSLLSKSSCINIYYERKLTPILTHLRRRKPKGRGGEGRPLP